MTCICGKPAGGAPHEHDVASHVAAAYHRPVAIVFKSPAVGFSTMQPPARIECASCGQPWVCPTARQYVRRCDPRRDVHSSPHMGCVMR